MKLYFNEDRELRSIVGRDFDLYDTDIGVEVFRHKVLTIGELANGELGVTGIVCYLERGAQADPYISELEDYLLRVYPEAFL